MDVCMKYRVGSIVNMRQGHKRETNGSWNLREIIQNDSQLL